MFDQLADPVGLPDDPTRHERVVRRASRVRSRLRAAALVIAMVGLGGPAGGLVASSLQPGRGPMNTATGTTSTARGDERPVPGPGPATTESPPAPTQAGRADGTGTGRLRFGSTGPPARAM